MSAASPTRGCLAPVQHCACAGAPPPASRAAHPTRHPRQGALYVQRRPCAPAALLVPVSPCTSSTMYCDDIGRFRFHPLPGGSAMLSCVPPVARACTVNTRAQTGRQQQSGGVRRTSALEGSSSQGACGAPARGGRRGCGGGPRRARPTGAQCGRRSRWLLYDYLGAMSAPPRRRGAPPAAAAGARAAQHQCAR